ncbi:MAG TPA: penicillin-binding protein activator [Anaeromyxobacteraceae bacterium]|nr:penicillin-binding protein activator [Anaeromyxobacteraceae bacterium]
MRPIAVKFLVLVLLSLAACPKRVTVNGQEMSVEEADAVARRDLEAVRAEARALPPAEAAPRLEAFAARYRGVPVAAEALHESAELWRRANRPEKALPNLSRLLTEYPLYPRAAEAKLDLGLADLALGRARDGVATIASVYEQVPEARRVEAARAAANGAEGAELWADAARWNAALARLLSGAGRDAALSRANAIVDDPSKLRDEDALRLAGELDADSPLRPAVTMRVARAHLRNHDLQRAQDAAREVFLRWPDGPYAADAKALADRLGRLSYVRPNVIGVAVPLSGNYKAWGDAIVRGIQLAVEGSGVKLAIRDTRGEPEAAAQAIEALTLEDGAIGIVGGVLNAEAERAAQVAEDLAVPFVSLSKQEGVTKDRPHVFQNMLTAKAQAQALADYAMGRRGMRRFAIMYPTITYGTELATAFWDEVLARGGEIRAAESYAMDRTTFTPLVKDMVGKAHLEERHDYQEKAKEIVETEKNPYRRKKALEKARDTLAPIVDFDAVFIPDFANKVKLIAPALAVEDVVTATCDPEEVEKIAKLTGRHDLRPVQLLGGNGWGGDPTLFDTSPGAPGRHVKCGIFVDGFFARSSREATRRFVEAYASKHGQEPTILEASAYDAAKMTRHVIEANRATTRIALRDGLAGIRAFKGATGDITMGEDRTPQKPLFFLTIDDEGVRELTPEELGTKTALLAP